MEQAAIRPLVPVCSSKFLSVFFFDSRRRFLSFTDTLFSCNSPNGTCVSSASGTASCQCLVGFADPFCLKPCPVCLNGGTCVSPATECSCPPPYFGNSCQFFNCPSNQCNGRGTCSPPAFACICSDDWGGNNCDTPTCASKNGCGSPINGTCISGTPPTCFCNNGFLPPSCEPTNSCPVCLNAGSCVPPSTECSCPPPFFGRSCQVRKICLI